MSVKTNSNKNLNDFIKYLNDTGKESAASLYQIELNNFAKKFSLEDFSVPDVELFITDMNPYSANAVIASLRKYCWFRAQHDDYVRWSRLHDGMSGMYKKPARVIKKEAMTLDEIRVILREIGGTPASVGGEREKKKPNVNDHLLDCVMLLFYFGFRPVELTVRLVNGNIDRKKQTVKIVGAKTEDERIIPYAEWVEPTLLRWIKFAREKVKTNKRPESWAHDSLRTRFLHGDMSVRFTPKMARKTVQTAMRQRGIAEWKTDYILGHTGRIPGIYTDWGIMVEDLRPVMDSDHYLKDIINV